MFGAWSDYCTGNVVDCTGDCGEVSGGGSDCDYVEVSDAVWDSDDGEYADAGSG